MFRNVAVIAAVAAAAIVASPRAHAQYYASPVASSAGPYATNPGPYGGYAPTPYSYGAYGGMIASNVAYAPGSFYGAEYGGPYSGQFRTAAVGFSEPAFKPTVDNCDRHEYTNKSADQQGSPDDKKSCEIKNVRRSKPDYAPSLGQECPGEPRDTTPDDQGQEQERRRR